MKADMKKFPEKDFEHRADFQCKCRICQFKVINNIDGQVWRTCAQFQVLYLTSSIFLKQSLGKSRTGTART